MGDKLHKNPPPPQKMEDVSPLFILQVKSALAANATHNAEFNLKPGDKDYRIATHADLATATKIDPNIIKHMFGGVRPGTKTKKISRSRFVGLIRHTLGIPQIVSVPFVSDRVRIARRLTELNREQWEEFSKKLDELEAMFASDKSPSK